LHKYSAKSNWVWRLHHYHGPAIHEQSMRKSYQGNYIMELYSENFLDM
jgi:hypothetical protein